jgi:ferric-dicitrate binding protein FerR (iron transport regulator)
MDCAGIREVGYDYLKGGLEPEAARALEAHAAACAGCARELRETRSALALLPLALPDLDPSPETWNRIEKKLPPRRAGAFKSWIRLAAAASILVALASFAMLFSGQRTGALPVVVESGKALKWNETFDARQFATLAIPDVGTLRINQGASLRFESPRRVLLEKGEVFADITPGGKGFEIRSADTTVRVHGTRFGVTAPATVYVVEGKVEVVSPRGRLELGPRQAAVESKLVELGAGDYLRWLARHERPSLRLTLDPGEQTTVSPGAPLKWRLTLETDALAPLYLAELRTPSQHLILSINDVIVPLDPNQAVLREASPAEGGRVRVDFAHRCVIECAVDPSLFREKGRAVVRAHLTSGEEAWVKSNSITVEVK